MTGGNKFFRKMNLKKWVPYLGWVFLLFFFTALAQAQAFELRILHVNDFHGFAEPYKPLGSQELFGGIAYLSARVNELRQEKPTLLLAAGDMIQGNNWANLSQGESVIELMNVMQFDAMVVGNHEFEFGQEVFKKRISETKFPILGANVQGLEDLKPWVIKELQGIKVGIIGIVTEETPVATHPRNVAGLRFLSPDETATKYIGEMKDKVDVMIILSHMGHPADRILAQKVKGIDVIVGGHSHAKVGKPVRIGSTLVVQAWEHGKALGVLDLQIQDGRMTGYEGRLEEVKPTMGKEDKAVRAIVEKYIQKMDLVLNSKIGETEVDLDGEKVRKEETNLGNFVTDIMRQVSGANIAIINGGTIRTSIKNGEERVKDVYSVLPFDNYIVAIRLTGKQIAEALEHGVAGIEDEEGWFPQVSGLSFKYSLSGKKGSRIEEILVAGQPLDLNKEYVVATNDFLAVGGDGYRAFAEAVKSSQTFSMVGGTMQGEKVVYSDSGRWLRDVVVESIKNQQKIAPRKEGRIVGVP